MPFKREHIGNTISFIGGNIVSTICSIRFINPMQQDNYIMFVLSIIFLLFLAAMGGLAGLQVMDMFKKRPG